MYHQSNRSPNLEQAEKLQNSRKSVCEKVFVKLNNQHSRLKIKENNKNRQHFVFFAIFVDLRDFEQVENHLLVPKNRSPLLVNHHNPISPKKLKLNWFLKKVEKKINVKKKTVCDWFFFQTE
jgi:hypothetical protein